MILVIDRANNRIEQALTRDPPEVSYIPRDDDIEIFSLPIAVLMACAVENRYIKRRYALGEAIRARKILQNENEDTLLEIARSFKWTIERERTNYAFKVNFVDFLRNIRYLYRQAEWKLVNKVMSNGQVYLSKHEIARLLQEEIREHLESKLNIEMQFVLSQDIADRVKKLDDNFAPRFGKNKFHNMPSETNKEAFPSCIKRIYQCVLTGRHLSHMERFFLTSFLLKVGMKTEDVISLFRSSSDFNERLTRYQVEHIAGSRGSQSEYLPPNCDSLRTHDICQHPNDICKTIKHPLTYYTRKCKQSRNDKYKK